MPEIKLTKLSLVSHRSKNGLTNLNQTKHVAAKKKKKYRLTLRPGKPLMPAPPTGPCGGTS